MIKQTAFYGDWIVVRHENNKIEVFKKCEKSAPAIREIAKELGFEIDPEWRTSQLGRNIIKAMTEAPQAEVPVEAEETEGEGISLIKKLRTEFIVETDDQVYYDAEGCGDEDIRDMFINNLKAQMYGNYVKKFEALKYTDADSFINYLNEDPDDLGLAQAIVVAAYCTFYGIEIDDNTRECADEQLYYFNDCQDFHYEYETDIDLG